MMLVYLMILSVGLINAERIVMLKGQLVPENRADYDVLLENRIVQVKIEDTTLADASAVVLSEQTFKLGRGTRFPVNFEILYPSAIINSPSHNIYTLSARVVSVDDDLLYLTDTRIMVPTIDEVDKIMRVTLVKYLDAVPDKNICALKPDSGMCFAYFERYYYDQSTRSCKLFVFGGCGGNMNNFETADECKVKCALNAGKVEGEVDNVDNSEDEIVNDEDDDANYEVESRKNTDVQLGTCQLSAERGPCRGFFERYHYNADTNTCEAFIYGGCDGNANNFETITDCQKSCFQAGKDKEPQTNLCELNAEPGSCKGFFERYHYNVGTNACETFIYGGCGGNANNFETMADCQKSCSQIGKESQLANLCDLGAEKGPCRGSFERYYYNADTNTCETFLYGGCGGNENNFEEMVDCQKSCSQAGKDKEPQTNLCELNAEAGPCRGSFERYHYKADTNTCETFIYGGCGGNENNFETIVDCQKSCSKAKP